MADQVITRVMDARTGDYSTYMGLSISDALCNAHILGIGQAMRLHDEGYRQEIKSKLTIGRFSAAIGDQTTILYDGAKI